LSPERPNVAVADLPRGLVQCNIRDLALVDKRQNAGPVMRVTHSVVYKYEISLGFLDGEQND
jgi:hypothetical protein